MDANRYGLKELLKMFKRIARSLFLLLPNFVRNILYPKGGYKRREFETIRPTKMVSVNEHILVFGAPNVEIRRHLSNVFCHHSLTFATDKFVFRRLKKYSSLNNLRPITRIFTIDSDKIYQTKLANKLNLPLEIITPFYNPYIDPSTWRPKQNSISRISELFSKNIELLNSKFSAVQNSNLSDLDSILPVGVLVDTPNTNVQPRCYFEIDAHLGVNVARTANSIEFISVIALALWAGDIKKRNQIFDSVSKSSSDAIEDQLALMLHYIVTDSNKINFRGMKPDFILKNFSILARLLVERQRYDDLGSLINAVIVSITESIDVFVSDAKSALLTFKMLRWSLVNCNFAKINGFQLHGSIRDDFEVKISKNEYILQS